MSNTQKKMSYTCELYYVLLIIIVHYYAVFDCSY